MSDEPSQLPPAPNGTSSVDPESIEGVFLTALAKSDPTEREKFLSDVCAGDPDKRLRVEALLRAYNDAGSFFEKPPLAGATVTQTLNFDFLEPSDDPSLLGKLGPYEIYEMIGRGGMGIVFRARDPKLNRVVAVKVLAPELAVNPNAKRRFVREAQAGAAISHPHVVTIHAVDDEEKLPFLVMECIVGQSLQEKLDQVGSLRLIEVLRISKQIAEGLSAAHHQGLIHRDIKPANVLLENGVERVKITDFGLARAIDDVSVTRTGEVAGSPQFMSPEQALGEKIDQRSDLFSLGCVMYAMCAGRSPFRATSIAASIRRVCDDEPRPLAEINPEVPDWMIAIIQKLLQKNPEKRIQTADEVVEILEAHLAGTGNVRVRPETASTQPYHAFSPRDVTDRAQTSSPAAEDVPILDLLSSSFMRLAILGPLVTLLLFFLWAMFPSEIIPPMVSLMLFAVGPALWGAALVGWLGSHVNHVEWRQEAYYKGRVASLLSFVTPPLWILGIPTGIVSWWVLSQSSVREVYRSRQDDKTATLAIPDYLLSLGVFLGATLTSLAALLMTRGHHFTITDVMQASLVVLGSTVLILPLRGSLYRGRFWKDFAIVLASFSIVATLLWLFYPHGTSIGINHPVEAVIALFLFGILLGLPGIAIWKLIVTPWTNESIRLTSLVTSVTAGQGNAIHSRRIRAYVGIAILLAVYVVQMQSRIIRIERQRSRNLTAQSQVRAHAQAVRQPTETPLGEETALPGAIDVNQLIGTWVVKEREDTTERETITIEPLKSESTSETDVYGTGLQLTFTDVGGNLQTGRLSINQAARSVSKQCSLCVPTKEGVLYQWFGNIELSRYGDHLHLNLFQVKIGEGDQPPGDFSRISQRDSALRSMDAWYQLEKEVGTNEAGESSTQ